MKRRITCEKGHVCKTIERGLVQSRSNLCKKTIVVQMRSWKLELYGDTGHQTKKLVFAPSIFLSLSPVKYVSRCHFRFTVDHRVQNCMQKYRFYALDGISLHQWRKVTSKFSKPAKFLPAGSGSLRTEKIIALTAFKFHTYSKTLHSLFIPDALQLLFQNSEIVMTIPGYINVLQPICKNKSGFELLITSMKLLIVVKNQNALLRSFA